MKLITKSGKVASVSEMPKFEVQHLGYNDKEKGFHIRVLGDCLLFNCATQRTRRPFSEVFAANENEDLAFTVEACKKQMEIHTRFSIESGEYELLEVVK